MIARGTDMLGGLQFKCLCQAGREGVQGGRATG